MSLYQEQMKKAKRAATTCEIDLEEYKLKDEYEKEGSTMTQEQYESEMDRLDERRK